MEMEKMMARLLAETRTNQAETDANLKEIKVNQREMVAEMDTRLEVAEACIGKLEANRETSETVEEHQEVPDEYVALETVGAQENRSRDREPAVGYRNQRKRQTKENDV
jgi:hypothetical protein